MSLEWLGIDGRFLDPGFLWLAPLSWLLALWRLKRPRAALPAASADQFAGLPRTLRARLWAAPLVALVLGASALAVALARPVTRDVLPIRSEGIDILLVVDTSSSMLATDVSDDPQDRRIDAARRQALEFAKARTNDRIGLLTFALFADLRCPPTLDEEALAAFVRSVETVQPRSAEDRTAIGVGLARAAELLKASDAASKVVVLLTDGQNNVAEILPEAAAGLAADAGVKCYTIGLGQGQQGPFGQMFEIDFGDLETIAAKTHGKFFRARTEADLQAVYAEIDRLEKRAIEDPRYRTTDWFQGPLAAAAALLVLALLLELGFVRGLP